ncbi:KilA-N domain-containing protein [Klebsiella pneumoniae]|uniref:KilA-N domain-containing protein n=1 Tax=Klebsiella pneumoniae TaxID=573 RepID=UPI003D054B8A
MNIINESGDITSVVLPVVVNGYSWECNQDRMWNLNELHKALDLPANKEPGQWRSSIKERLIKDANLHVLAGRIGGTWATEEAAIAYAMWVSDDFYLTVIRAFIALRNNSVVKASNLAKQNAKMEPISTAEFAKLDSFGWSLTDTMKKAQVTNPKLVMKVLKSGKFHNPFFCKGPLRDLSDSGIRANVKGKQSGYWKAPEGDGRYNRDGVKALRKGFEWFVENRSELARQVAMLPKTARKA